MIRLLCGKNKGYLYHFRSSWKTIEKIIANGLKGTALDLTWEEGKQIGKTEDNLARFASLTRNPSAIIQFANPEWRYAVILDGNILSDTEILRPFFSHVDPGNLAINIKQVADGYEIETENTHARYHLTQDEGDEVLDFIFDDRWEFYLNFEGDLTREGLTVTFNLGKDNNYEEDVTLLPRESYGPMEGPGSEEAEELYMEDFDDGRRRPLTLKDFPGPLYQALMATGYESEERLYKKNPEYGPDDEDKYFNIKKALVGVLVPDVEYFSAEGERFRRKYPDLPMYIYRDWAVTPSNTEEYKEFKEMLRLNPEVKQLYRYPR